MKTDRGLNMSPLAGRKWMRRDGEVARHRRRPYTLTITAAVGSPCPLVTRMTAANTTVSKIPSHWNFACRARTAWRAGHHQPAQRPPPDGLRVAAPAAPHQRTRPHAGQLPEGDEQAHRPAWPGHGAEPAQGDRRTAQGQPVRGASASTTTAHCRSASCSSCAWSCCRRGSASNCGPG